MKSNITTIPLAGNTRLDDENEEGNKESMKNKTLSCFDFTEFRQQRLNSLAGLEKFDTKTTDRVVLVPGLDMTGKASSEMGNEDQITSERVDSVRSNFSKVFDDDMLQLLNPVSSRLHSYESRINRRRSLSNSSKNSSNTNSPEVNSIDLQKVVHLKQETGLSSFLWKQSKDFIYILISIGERGFYDDEKIELDVQIKSKRIFASFNEKGSDIPNEVFVNSELSVEIQPEESGWCIRNSHLLFELKKRDSSDDIQFPMQSPLRVRVVDEENCRYEVSESDAPLHKEIHQSWFSCIEEDITKYYFKFSSMKKGLSETELSDDDLEEAEQLYNEAMEHPDLDEAFIIYKEAADMGHAPSRFAFANLCLIEEDNPFKIKRSESMALKYLEMASLQNGYGKASFKTAMMYIKGTGVEKNYEMAKIFFMAACIQEGDPKSMLQLGALYEDIANQKTDETSKQEKMFKAMAWYRLAINRGFSNACFSASLLMHKKKDKSNNFESSMAFFNLGRAFSSKLDENAFLTKTTKKKFESIEETDELIIPHWSPRKGSVKPKNSIVGTRKTSISYSRKQKGTDPVETAFKALEKFSLPNETQLLKKQIEKLHAEKYSLQETIERLKHEHERQILNLNTEINNLKSELQLYKHEEKTRNEDMSSIAKLRETLTQFKEQELRLAIHHALLSLKLRANTNLALPPLVDKAISENIGMDDLGGWFQSQCESYEGGG